MDHKHVVTYTKKNNQPMPLQDTIENLILMVMDRGYTRIQARVMLADQLGAGWIVDAIIDGVVRMEEYATETPSTKHYSEVY